MKTNWIRFGFALALTAGVICAQEPVEAAAGSKFDKATSEIQAKLEASTAELKQLQDQIANETLPLSRELNQLEAELRLLNQEFQQTSRSLTASRLELTTLEKDAERRKKVTQDVEGLLADYINKLDSLLHVAEKDRYESTIKAAQLASQNEALSHEEVYAAQAAVLDTSLQRIDEILDGSRFEGNALDPKGVVKEGTYVLLGPAAIFKSKDGVDIGAIEQPAGSQEPKIVPFLNPEDTKAAENLIEAGWGTFPLDPTLGDARAVEETEDETFLEHVQKGGNVMYAIGTLAGLALLVALFKWLSLSLVRKPSRRKVNALFDAIGSGDEELAKQLGSNLSGPAGRMLNEGVNHMREPRELVEEVMYEHVLRSRLKTQGMLPFIAICAASAPLLGLLGTVTGIIETFKLITVFGAGDVKMLSGGISEALITTKFGLIVAIPSLLLHMYLSRRARSIVSHMESSALAFANQVSRTPIESADPNDVELVGVPDPDIVRVQVNEILNEMLGPIAAKMQRESGATSQSEDGLRAGHA